MHTCRPIFKFAFYLFWHSLFFFFFSLRICKLTILEYVAVYSWSLQSTLTGIPLPENSNRVAIQFGASTWVNSMKPTEAKLYHSLGDGGKWMKTPVFIQKYGHMTQVFSYSGKQRAVKRNQNEISPFWRCNTGLASIYRPIYCSRKGEGGPEYFIVRRGGISYSLSLAFRILRIHICQLSLRKIQKKKN